MNVQTNMLMYGILLVNLLAFDSELIGQILLVCIPVVGGALTAYKVTNSWQMRKDKIEMKEKVVTVFVKAAKDPFNIH